MEGARELSVSDLSSREYALRGGRRFGISFGGTGVYTQGFPHAKQVLNCLSQSSSTLE
jgi:hypothetical protein